MVGVKLQMDVFDPSTATFEQLMPDPSARKVKLPGTLEVALKVETVPYVRDGTMKFEMLGACKMGVLLDAVGAGDPFKVGVIGAAEASCCAVARVPS